MTFLGGATGLYYGYLDLIAWDLPAVLDAAREFFAGTDMAWGGFHVFRRDVGAVRLWEQEGEPQVDAKTGSLLSAQDIEMLGSFEDGVLGYFGKMLQWLEDFIERGVETGRFTRRQARQDLKIALWYSYACNNLDGSGRNRIIHGSGCRRPSCGPIPAIKPEHWRPWPTALSWSLAIMSS